MPLYDFRCPECATAFEAQVPYGDRPPCPACGATGTERLMSGFAGPFTIRPRGGEAKRLDATRAAKEQQRLERKASRAEKRRQEG